jgi:hypothetical protein
MSAPEPTRQAQPSKIPLATQGSSTHVPIMHWALNTRIAALVMREGRWDAGTALMQAASPSGWGRLVDSADVVRLNDDALRACRAAAAKAKKAQRCTITVSAN